MAEFNLPKGCGIFEYWTVKKSNMNISSKISDFGRLVYSNWGLYACKIWHGYRTNSYKCNNHILDAFIHKWP